MDKKKINRLGLYQVYAEGFTAVNVNDKIIHAIQKKHRRKWILRNPTEFVTVAVREKIDEIHRRQIDKRKLDAFFIREQQIRAKYTNHTH
jgi:hypothetical protein